MGVGILAVMADSSIISGCQFKWGIASARSLIGIFTDMATLLKIVYKPMPITLVPLVPRKSHEVSRPPKSVVRTFCLGDPNDVRMPSGATRVTLP